MKKFFERIETFSELSAVIFAETGVISLPDLRFSVIDGTSADAERCYDFRLHHAVKVTLQNRRLDFVQAHGFENGGYFGIIIFFFFKAVDRIGGKCLIVRKIYGFDDRSMPVRSVPQSVNKMVYFPITGKFYRDLFSFSVFPVNLRDLSSDESIQEADGGLGYVVAVWIRYIRPRSCGADL